MLTDRDNLLIYYAGHGEIDKTNQSAYWLPTDAEIGNPANCISSQSITEFLSIMPAKHVMVVADSCYSISKSIDQLCRGEFIRPWADKPDPTWNS